MNVFILFRGNTHISGQHRFDGKLLETEATNGTSPPDNRQREQ